MNDTRCMRFLMRFVLLALLFFGFTGEGFLTSCPSGPLRALKRTSHGLVAGHTAVLTYKYDNQRTGATTHETILAPANVNVKQFGKRLAYPIDGQIYAQPLYVPNLTIGGQTRNVVFVATEHDSVYAFDYGDPDCQDRKIVVSKRKLLS